MSEKKNETVYPKLRPLTEKHLKNLYNVQLDDNCSKITSSIGKIKCNICEYETDLEFLHFGKNKRPNEKCPNCYSLKRTRLLWYYLENKTDFLNNEDIRVLHTAPETSIYKKIKEDFGDRYISSDIFESPFIDEIIDIQNIPYEDNTFDLIITSHVLEHVPDDFIALQEFYRVLKPNGKVIILIPSLPYLKKTFELPQINSPELRQRYYKQHDHRRYYGDDDFYRLLELVGFRTIKEDKYFLKDYEEIKLRHSLADDPIFVATKIIDEDKNSTKEIDADFCSICESDVTFKTDKMNDKICSQCHSTSQERLYYSQIKEFISSNSNILYINPKDSLNSKLKSLTQNYSSLPDEQLLNKGFMGIFKNNNDVDSNDILKQIKMLPEKNYDIILTYHLLDNEEKDIQLLEELSRIIKGGGRLLLKENIDLELLYKIEDESINTSKLRKMFYGNPSANRCYGRDFIDSVRNNGFVVEYENPEKQGDNLKLKDQLIKDPLLICTKK